MKTSALLQVVTMVLGSAASAQAMPIAVAGDDGKVTITVEHARATSAPRAHGDRIEIALSGDELAVASVDSEDPTVKHVQLIGGDSPKISLQLHHTRRTTERLAKGTQVLPTEDGIRIIIPREPENIEGDEAPSAAPAEPKSTAPIPPPTIAHATQRVAKPAPAPVKAGPAVAARASMASAIAEAKMAAPIQLAVAHPSRSAPVPEALAPLPLLAETRVPATVQAGSDPTRTLALATLFLGGCGAVVLLARKRKTGVPAPESIRVLGARSLGGKTRVVLLGAGDRELLVSIGDQGARLIDGWPSDRSGRSPAPHHALPADLAGDELADDEDLEKILARSENAFEAEITGVRRAPEAPTVSPAIAGLLKLRAKGAPPSMVSDEVVSGDLVADVEWAKELREAMRSSGGVQ